MTRNKTYDVLKGLLIILVVMGHTQFFGHDFVFLFHMGCFFIISGYFFDFKKVENKKELIDYIKRKIKGLYIPFVLYNIFFIICNNLLFKINFTSDYFSLFTMIKRIALTLLFYGRTNLTDSTWFLQSLFFISAGYGIVSYLLRNNENKIAILGIISVLLSLIGFILNKINFNIYQIGTICSSFILFYIGHMGKHIKLNKFNKEYLKIVLFGFSIGYLLILNNILRGYIIRVMQNQIYNPLIYISASVFGFIMMYLLADFISNRKKIATNLSFLGRNTMPILCLHITSFKLVTLIEILCSNIEIEKLSIVPVYDNKYWIILTIVGTIVPIVINILLKNAININNKKKRSWTKIYSKKGSRISSGEFF